MAEESTARRGPGWWWRSLRVRAFLVTFAVAGVALLLYSRSYALPRLALIVLPCAAALGWWLGWRMVRPIERLREQALAQVETLVPGADLQLPRSDEFGELTAAFNRLLAELRTRAQEKEAFVADLAHEFKNPVAAIRAASEALEDGPPDEARLARLSRIVGDSSRRLDELVTQFLELARAEAGMRADAREAVDVGALGRRCVEAIASDERYAALRFSCEVAEPSPVVDGVASGLQTVVVNLLENAASFASSAVTLIIEAGDSVTVMVRDDGPGIAEADRDRIFERFYTRRASGKGTGLGLAMVRAIVEAHDGRVRVDAPEDGGTAIAAVLPARRG